MSTTAIGQQQRIVSMSECIIGGRPATLLMRPATMQTVRVRRIRKEWGWYNRVIGRFTDTNETFDMGAGEFSKWSAKLDKEFARRLLVEVNPDFTLEKLP